jgi:SAM-dependent methyltransferase
MVTDKKEMEIIARARQKNVSDPKRSREPFHRIFADFFSSQSFDGKIFLDMGAGHFDFCEIARSRGAVCMGLDKDPAVLELGRYKGFQVIEADLKKIKPSDFPAKYDGIFNKFTLNAFWHLDRADFQENLVGRIVELLKPDGWAWIAPWNGAPKNIELSARATATLLEKQKDIFTRYGFNCISLSPQ